MSLLKIIDNPFNDIELVTVLRTMIGNFTDNELIKIRLENKNKSFYEAMCSYKNVEDKLELKIKSFLDKIAEFRKCKEYMPLNEFIWKIYLDTGYYNYVSLMPNGALRIANLKMLFEKAKQYENTTFKGLYNFISFIDKLKLSNKDMSGARLIGENEDVIRIMSIHKSKGLEFPIVFLSSTSKRFNMQDLNKNAILLHQDIGIGPKYINYEKGITYDTLAREAIKCKAKEEMISEEMRILYVALTRAKEKLIITGLEKDYKKSIDKKEELLRIYKNADENRINKNILKKHITYLDWLELVYLNSKEELKDTLELYVHNKEKLLKQISKEEQKDIGLKEFLEKKETSINSELKEKLEWEYKYKTLEKILTKSSVTDIKNMKMNIKKEYLEYNTPEFLKSEKIISPAEKGTIIHLIFQKLNEKENYNLEKIEEFLNELAEKKIIKEEEKSIIDANKIYKFTKSKIWEEMKTAKDIQREKPFYINIPALEIYEEEISEKILVQGIIDLYYITSNDKLILVDYKTDIVKREEDLILKYEEQLNIYKRALEISLKKKVDNIYIYSIYLDKEIKI